MVGELGRSRHVGSLPVRSIGWYIRRAWEAPGAQDQVRGVEQCPLLGQGFAERTPPGGGEGSPLQAWLGLLEGQLGDNSFHVHLAALG